MAQRKQVSWAQLRVGLLVVVAITIFAVLVFLMTGEGFFTTKYTIHSYLDNAGGLKKGDPVRLAGIDVGNVEKIQVSGSHDPLRAVEVTMHVQRRYQEEIRADSLAILETEGLLGQRFMDISRGSLQQPRIEPGGEVKVRLRPDLGDVMASSGTVLTNLNRVFTSVNRIMDQVETGRGTLGKLVYDESLYTRADGTLKDIQKLVAVTSSGQGSLGKLITSDEIYNRANSSVGKLDQMIDDVRSGKGSFGKFVYDPALYDQTQRMLARANNIVTDVDSGKGSLGKMIKDDSFYRNANSAVQKFDSLAGRMDSGQGSFGKLLRDPALYNNMNSFSTELRALLADFRKDPKRFLTIHLKLF